MRILIVGKHLLGTAAERQHARQRSVHRQIRRVAPQILINAAAYTAVDKAESEPAIADKINAKAPVLMAEEMKRAGGLLVHYCTDFVYDGTKPSPYTEHDAPSPLNVYGASKLAGDQGIAGVSGAHLIFRTSWVYGARGKNFLKTILRLAEEAKPLRVVDDQRGAPTWSRDIATATGIALAHLKRSAQRTGQTFQSVGFENSGLYHMSAAGEVTWFEFASAILEHREQLEKRFGTGHYTDTNFSVSDSPQAP